jgi:hypothetical protein
MDLIERACRLLDGCEASVSGQGGHARCYAAACALVQGFDFDDETAMRLLAERFNPRCSPPWSERELRHKVGQARLHGGAKGFGYLLTERDRRTVLAPGRRISGPSVAEAEPTREKKRRPFDEGALKRMQNETYKPGPEWLMERSPVDVAGVTPERFLDEIFQPGERALVFFRFKGQGEYGKLCGEDGRLMALGPRPGVEPVAAAEIPRSGKEGAWYLPVPVDGKWHPTGNVDDYGRPMVSRRSGASVEAWRHLVLESDHADEKEWLNFLCQLPLPIAAIYTSGSRSIHALVRVDASSKGVFDAFRDRISPFLSKLGADPAAMTAVRLTRLPGVFREGTTDKDGKYVRFPEPRLQRLLFLNPRPEVVAVKTMTRLRELTHGENR